MRMHIVYVVSDTAYGGGTRYFASLVQGLKGDEYSFGVACRPGTGLESYFHSLGVELYPFTVRSRFDISGMIKFARLLSELKIDCLLLGDGLAWNSGIFIRILSGIRHIWAIVHMTHIGLEIRKFGRIERFTSAVYDYLWSQSCELIVASNRKNAHILSGEGVAKSKLRVIPNCIEFGKIHHKEYQSRDIILKRHGIAGNPRIVGMVARLGPGKDFTTLLSAAAQIVGRHRDWVFMLIGTGPLREELESRVRDFGISGRVIFTGWVEDAYEYMSIFDIFVFSTVAEGIPYGILEAMVFGLPIVSTNNGAISEAVADGESGLLVEPGNAGALAAALEDLILNPGRAESLGKNALETVRKNFDLPVMLNSFDMLFKERLNHES